MRPLEEGGGALVRLWEAGARERTRGSPPEALDAKGISLPAAGEVRAGSRVAAEALRFDPRALRCQNAARSASDIPEGRSLRERVGGVAPHRMQAGDSIREALLTPHGGMQRRR